MSVDPLSAQTGMDVYGSDAELVGTVQDVRPDAIVVVRRDDSTKYVIPRDYLAQVSESDYRVDLTITGSQARQLDATQ